MIIDTLKEKEKVTLVGFGTFNVVKRAPRKAINPRTGKLIKIEAKNALKFTPGKALKKAVQ